MVKRFPLKRRSDERGWLLQNDYPALASEFKHFILSTTKPGGVRGNHYNKRKTKWFLVYGGEAEFKALHVETKQTYSAMLHGSEPELIQIDPLVTFSLKNIGEGEMLFFEIVNETFDPEESDSYPYEVK